MFALTNNADMMPSSHFNPQRKIPLTDQNRSPSSGRRNGSLSVVRADLVSTHDTDEAADIIRKVYSDARVFTAAGAPFSCAMSAVMFGDIQRISATWSAGAQLDSNGLLERYAITIAKDGLAHGSQNAASVDIVPEQRAAIFSPNRPVHMWIDGVFQARTLTFDSALLKRHFLALTGNEAPRNISFDEDFRSDSTAGTSLFEVLSLFHGALDREDASPLWLASLRDTMLTGLLVHVRHTGSRFLDAPPPRAKQASVRRAEEFIAAHAAEPIGLADIVAAADVPERSLRAAFKAQGRPSPMELLRHHRFELARKGLETPTPTTTIARIITDLGLGNPGRFSTEYRKRFGEAPSETLERGLVRLGLQRRRPL